MPTKADSPWESRSSKAVVPIRVLVGWVFLSEGVQNFLFPDSLGVGRFVKIGIPCRRSWPHLSVWLRSFAVLCC
jgi:putative oxidoreductase